jgi:hypothetical protein
MWLRRLSEHALLASLALAAPRAHATPRASAGGETPDDPLAAYRGQFKLGMERYNAGALAEAIGYWEPIYRELGDENGYRLAYDLGIAYQQLGDATRAAERLQAFLVEAEARRTRGEATAAIVEKEKSDARVRVDGLIATKGRVYVEAGSVPRSARLDASEPRLAGFVAWVAPGLHTVTFAAGTLDMETRIVHVEAGEIVEVAPKPQLPVDTTPEPPVLVLPPAPLVEPREMHRPFAWPLIAITGGVAVVAGIAAVPLENTALSLFDRYQNERATTGTISQVHRDHYANTRTSAYAAVGGAIGFTVVTAGLAVWYFLGTSERDVIVRPTLSSELGGASLGLVGRF